MILDLKSAISGLFFFIFVFSIHLTVNKWCIKSLLMTGLKPRTSGVESNQSINWATTTAHDCFFTWGPEFKTSSLAILIEHLFFDYCAEKTKIKTNMNNRLQYVNRLLNFRGTILWNSIFTFFYAILWNNTSAHIRPSAAPTTLEQPPQLRCSARF